jgi:hypothetical protein
MQPLTPRRHGAFLAGPHPIRPSTYYYVSRLQHENAPLADYVVHPGIPRTVRFKLQYTL